MRNKISTSFRLSRTALDMLKALSGDMGISQADVIEVAVRDLSKEREKKKPFRITKEHHDLAENIGKTIGVPASNVIAEIRKHYEKQGRAVVEA